MALIPRPTPGKGQSGLGTWPPGWFGKTPCDVVVLIISSRNLSSLSISNISCSCLDCMTLSPPLEPEN